MTTNDNSFLKESEMKILEDNNDKFELLVNALFQNGEAPGIKNIRIAKEVLEARSKSIVDVATLRQKQHENETNEGQKELTAEILRQISQKRSNELNSNTLITEIDDDELKDVELVDGELDITPEQLNPEDFKG